MILTPIIEGYKFVNPELGRSTVSLRATRKAPAARRSVCSLFALNTISPRDGRPARLTIHARVAKPSAAAGRKFDCVLARKYPDTGKIGCKCSPPCQAREFAMRKGGSSERQDDTQLLVTADIHAKAPVLSSFCRKRSATTPVLRGPESEHTRKEEP